MKIELPNLTKQKLMPGNNSKFASVDLLLYEIVLTNVKALASIVQWLKPFCMQVGLKKRYQMYSLCIMREKIK